MCGESCLPDDCGSGFICDAVGLCVSTDCVPTSDPCGTRVCGTEANGTCGEVNCPPGCDEPEFTCNVITGQCESSCGDGICQEWEDCSCSDCEGEQAPCDDPGETCDSGICVFNAGGEFNSCGDYCALFGYSHTFACQDTPQKCEPPQGPEGGIYIGDLEGANEIYGNSFCLGSDHYCCCRP